MQSTSVRIDTSTHDDLKRLAAGLNTTVGNTVTLAVRPLRQARIGAHLQEPLRDDEDTWLDVELIAARETSPRLPRESEDPGRIARRGGSARQR